MVVEGIHVEDIFYLVSLVLSLIISLTFGIMAHEEDQYTVMFRKYKAGFLAIALKQTKAGLRSSDFCSSNIFGLGPNISSLQQFLLLLDQIL